MTERDPFAGTAGGSLGAVVGQVDVVHVVAKTHLDLGFTALAAEVADQYVHDFFPRAVATAAELRDADGPERLVWSTGAWPLWHALEVSDAQGRAAIEAAIAAGDLAWHALPLTTHTELLTPSLLEVGLGISAELDRRFGRTTTAAKLTDVPGHTIGLVPHLAAAGVTLLHIGVNPAWPVPEVPAVFRWRADQAEVVVVYQAGGYGGFTAVPGCREALAFLHTGDNLGPPSADAVRQAHADLRHQLPGVEVRGSTLDAFARALAASPAGADLPVVTSEIGDAWIFGAGSDPQKLAAYGEVAAVLARRLARDPADPEAIAAGRTLLLVPEHTWGLDQKSALPDEAHWDRGALAELRATPAGQRFEASWAEQRAYVRDAAAQLGAGAVVDVRPVHPMRDHRWRLRTPVPAGERHGAAGWELAADPTSGALVHLRSPDGRVLADVDHPLGLMRYQTFDAADYERFYAGLVPVPEDEWWARWDNTKPGLQHTAAVSRWWGPEVLGTWWLTVRDVDGEEGVAPAAELVVGLRFAGDATERFGAAPEVWTTFRVADEDRVEVEVAWFGKPACRFPEATWCSFVPRVADPAGWRLRKLGRLVDPCDVVRHGGRALHGTSGLRYAGPDGGVDLDVPDPSLVAPGRPVLLDADPPIPDLAGGLHVLLHDNLWGTNFPMWNEGDAAFSFALTIDQP